MERIGDSMTFDLNRCVADPNVKKPSTRQDTIERLRKEIAEWDTTRLAHQGRAGKRRLQGILEDLEKNP